MKRIIVLASVVAAGALLLLGCTTTVTEETTTTTVDSAGTTTTLAGGTTTTTSAGGATTTITTTTSTTPTISTTTTTAGGGTTTTAGSTTTTNPSVVSTPSFALASSSYEAESIVVTIECGTSGAAIFYTLDGSTPSPAATVYSGAFTLANSRTIKALAVKAGLQTSEAVSAQYDLYGWTQVGNPIGDGNYTINIYALALDNSGNLYAGGDFTVLDNGAPGNFIAKWNGSSWSALTAEVNSTVYALEINSNYLYAGGSFTTAGGSAARRIARWNGSAWTEIGQGAGALVRALAFDNSNNLYIGGGFTTVGPVASALTVNRIAQWNGSQWSALGSSPPGIDDGTVFSIAATSANNVYAGGDFIYAAGNQMNALAQWTGTSWDFLQGGLSKYVPAQWSGDVNVRALRFADSGDLYAGGLFDQAGVRTTESVAKWANSNWSALGSGASGRVYAIAFDDQGRLYAGGSSGTCVLDRWDGTAWTSGLGGATVAIDMASIYAIAADNSGSVYVAGTGDYVWKRIKK